MDSVRQEKQIQAVQHRELEEENDLMLGQLHQVQEELERYFLANRELRDAMRQSTGTLHSARCLIAGLVTTG